MGKKKCNATKGKSNKDRRQGDIVVKEDRNCKIGRNNVRESGRKEGNPVHHFGSCYIVMSPQRAVGALSCLTTSSLNSGFDALPS